MNRKIGPGMLCLAVAPSGGKSLLCTTIRFRGYVEDVNSSELIRIFVEDGWEVDIHGMSEEEKKIAQILPGRCIFPIDQGGLDESGNEEKCIPIET